MRLLLGMLAGLAIGVMVGLVCFLAVLFSPTPSNVSDDFDGGAAGIIVLGFIAAGFMAGCGIIGGIIGLIVAIAEPDLPDDLERLAADGRAGEAHPAQGKLPLPYDDDFA